MDSPQYAFRWKVQARKRLTEVNHLRLDLKLMKAELDKEEMDQNVVTELHKALRALHKAVMDGSLQSILDQEDGPMTLQGLSIIGLYRWMVFKKNEDQRLRILLRRDPAFYYGWLERVEKFFRDLVDLNDVIPAVVYDMETGEQKLSAKIYTYWLKRYIRNGIWEKVKGKWTVELT